MKKARITLSLFALVGVLLTTSCKKDDNQISDGDYLMFGHFYGMCGGEQCVEIFRLEETKLFEDQNDDYPGQTDFYNGDYVMLSDTKYDQVKDLIDYFPNGLLNETDKVIGTPDAGDWGGYYIEYKQGGVHKFWLIDKMTNNIPSYMHPFIQKVEEKIALINS